VVQALTAVAYMNHGRWVARCPLGCGSAEQRGPGGDGTMGGLESDRFTCRPEYGGCGWRGPVTWPADIADLERVLLARPSKVTRNWQPGESLFDLIAENAAHGIVPAAALEPGWDGWLLRLVDGQVVAGELEFTTEPLRQIGA
jgi:hypothetical protein